MLLATGRREAPALSVLELPELTTTKLDFIMVGSYPEMESRGWIRAFAIQHRPQLHEGTLYGEWLAAIKSMGADLWGLFARDLVKELVAKGVKTGARLVILPNDTLSMLPLGLAQDPATGCHLLDVYDIMQAPSLEALAAAARRIATPAAPTLAAVINPTGLIPSLALPFTETEGALVAAHFSPATTVVLDKSNATPDTVLAALINKSYWHFSCHGSFDWFDPRHSGLKMKDERVLTVGRLLEEQGALGRPRLVVLSACETGLHKPDRNSEEFVGLPATFMQLGATGVIGTLWQVDDMATALLMAKFYDLHVSQGLSPPAALKGAQGWLREATRPNLIAFLKAAAAKTGASGVTLVNKLERSLMRGQNDNPRFASIAKLLQQNQISSPTYTPSLLSRLLLWKIGPKRKERPFAHPYYWGGFVYTGL